MSRLAGDPAYLYLPLDSSEAQRQAFPEANGFNDPLYVQFGRYLLGVANLDFGTALSRNRPAMEVALETFPQTLKLAAIAMSLALALSIVVGSLATAKPDSLFDRIAGTASLAGASAPDFWVAIVAILVFSVGLGLLPTSGTGTPLHWIMPIFAPSLRPFGLLVQVMRDFIRNFISGVHRKQPSGWPPRRQTFSFLGRTPRRNSGPDRAAEDTQQDARS